MCRPVDGSERSVLADTVMPEAFVGSRPLNVFATPTGFFVSFALSGG